MILYKNNSTTLYIANPTENQQDMASYIKWRRNLISLYTKLSTHTARPFHIPLSRLIAGHGETPRFMWCEISFLVTQQSIELFIQICQEFIDLTVFTVSLQIETCKLESDPAKHIAGLPAKAVHPFLPQCVDKLFGLAVILLLVRIDTQGDRIIGIGKLYPYFHFIIVGHNVK